MSGSTCMQNGLAPPSPRTLRSPRSVVGRRVVLVLVASASAAFVGQPPSSAQSSSNTAAPLTAPTVPPSATIPRATSASPRPAAPRTTRKRAKTTVKAKPKTTVAPVGNQDGSLRASVSGAGSKGVAVRETPAISGTLISRKPEGTIIRIACEVAGEAVKDLTSGRSSAVWVRLTSGGFVASIYTTAFQAGEISGTRKLQPCAADGSVASTIVVATTKKPAAAAPPSSGVVSAKGAVSTVAP